MYSNPQLVRQKRVLVSRHIDGIRRHQDKIQNPYFLHSKLSTFRFEKILRSFADDVPAVQTAKRSGVAVRSVNEVFQMLRERIREETTGYGNWVYFNLAGYPLHDWEWEEECAREECSIETVGREIGREISLDGNPDQYLLFAPLTTGDVLQIAARRRKATGQEPPLLFGGLPKDVFRHESTKRNELRAKAFKLRVVGRLWNVRIARRKLPKKHRDLHLTEMYVREICRCRHIREYLRKNDLPYGSHAEGHVLDLFSDNSLGRSARASSNDLFYRELRRSLLERPLGVSFERINDNTA
ncbi:MAG TPA: hypothetical protein VGE08_03980 [Steroidobacter sp.]|uniref:hypothetical protein n=1 Tax=Steroidobacter sp. TaxID=1978227 RepID=UPI002ED9766D